MTKITKEQIIHAHHNFQKKLEFFQKNEVPTDIEKISDSQYKLLNHTEFCHDLELPTIFEDLREFTLNQAIEIVLLGEEINNNDS